MLHIRSIKNNASPIVDNKDQIPSFWELTIRSFSASKKILREKSVEQLNASEEQEKGREMRKEKELLVLLATQKYFMIMSRIN